MISRLVAGGPRANAPWSLGAVVEAICLANCKSGRRPLPTREAVAGIVSGLRAALFPWHFGASDVSGEGLAYYVGRTLDACLGVLEEQVQVALLFDCQHGEEICDACSRRATSIVREFASHLPGLREVLGSDARAAYEGDPAATSTDETIFSYAGVTAIT
jgi:serine O-acetyltransferase